ncbi:MAG: hypothetical protein J5718_02485, partial [Lachnospiraceae bacterium]|nr:hypothetical protein [Lachnospiraceae bacterium]
MVRLAALKTGKSTVKITLKQGGKTYKYKIKVKVQDIDDRGNDCHEWRVDDAMRDYYDYPERLNGYIDSYERLVTAKSEEDLPAGYKLLTGDELKQVQGYLEEDKEERKQYEKLKKKLMGSTEYETVKNINDFLANEYVPPEIVAGGSNKDINFGFLCSYCGIKCMRISWDYYDEITAGTDILESYGHYKVSIDGVWYNIRPGSTPKSAYGIEHGFFLTSDAETPGYDNWENDGLTNSLTTIGYVSATSISYPVFKTFDEARGYIKKDKQFNETTDQSAALIDYCLRCIYDAAENGTDIEADNFKTMRELLKTAVDVFPFNFTQSVDEMEKECFSILLNDKYNFYPAAVEAFSRYYGYGSFAEYFDKYLYECYKNNGDVPYHLKEYFWADCVRGKGYTPVYCTAE